ncbi:GNAT family N-acetyltransferase [Xaviernesmea rhizosphaerae]|uniref:GNAT family N-acetyltransferase n=1 Tax=Xaviernesmea rhizosphaerae TaxID=1672749 RepID=UPI000A4023C9
MIDYDVDVRPMDALSSQELYALLKLRTDVFIVEQACIYPELDGRDPEALHLRLLSGGDLLAAARLFGPGEMAETVKIGRVVVAPDHRGRGLGQALWLKRSRSAESSSRPIIAGAASARR